MRRQKAKVLDQRTSRMDDVVWFRLVHHLALTQSYLTLTVVGEDSPHSYAQFYHCEMDLVVAICAYADSYYNKSEQVVCGRERSKWVQVRL